MGKKSRQSGLGGKSEGFKVVEETIQPFLEKRREVGDFFRVSGNYSNYSKRPVQLDLQNKGELGSKGRDWTNPALLNHVIRACRPVIGPIWADFVEGLSTKIRVSTVKIDNDFGWKIRSRLWNSVRQLIFLEQTIIVIFHAKIVFGVWGQCKGG